MRKYRRLCVGLLFLSSIVSFILLVYNMRSHSKYSPYPTKSVKVNKRRQRESTPDIIKTILNAKNKSDSVLRNKPPSSYAHCFSGNNVSNENTAYAYTGHIFKEPLSSWIEQQTSYCDGNVSLFPPNISFFQNAIVDASYIEASEHVAGGGEPLHLVLNQQLEKELYQPTKGFFSVVCTKNHNRNDLSDIFETDPFRSILLREDFSYAAGNFTTVDKLTIAINRSDYANLWNHMCEMYGIFLMLVAFQKQPSDVILMVIDGHPYCNLDKDWEHVFGPIARVGQFDRPVLFKQLVSGLPWKENPLSHWYAENMSYVEEFRTFLLNQYGLKANSKLQDCKKLTLTLLIRRNQVYHPRNKDGDVERKIFNELDLVEGLMNSFPGVCAQALLMESIPMRSQLDTISNTDVLVGMHGAGMMHLLFLPGHAGVVEMFPYMYKEERPHSVMFENMAKWRSLRYHHWESFDKSSKVNSKLHIVNVNDIVKITRNIIERMCPGKLLGTL